MEQRYVSRVRTAPQRGRYTLGGFTDATFAAMKTLEDGRNATWPF